MSEMFGQSLAVGVDLHSFVERSSGNYLEIGCFDGYNLASLASKFPDRKIFGIDPFISDGHLGNELSIGSSLTDQRHNLYRNIENFENISFFEMTSEDFIKNHSSRLNEMNISSIFVDGAHIYDFVVIDCDLAIQCIMNNEKKLGEVIFHDLHVDDVNRAIEYFKSSCVEKNIECISGGSGKFTLRAA